MKMKFSLAPGTETGFSQWLDAMKMVAQLPGGVPSEFRMKLWLQLSERHLSEQNIDWEKAEAVIFNEWTNPDDEELGVQIVKVTHCSVVFFFFFLFYSIATRVNPRLIHSPNLEAYFLK